MRTIPFVKMSGAGNDFVAVEASRLPRGASLPALARRLCDRRRGVGADGLLLLRRARGGPELRYWNADGTAAFCANGSRCAAWRMRQLGWTGRRFAFKSSRGPIAAEIAGAERARIRMPESRVLVLGLRLEAAGRRLVVHRLDTGSPHAVAEVASLERFPVIEAGRALRSHRAFGRPGANADFVSFRPRGARGPMVLLRTYERGVEDETLACGTGAAAAALVAHVLKGFKPPVTVLTRGGERLVVDFSPARRGAGRPARFKDVWLEGPARVVFEGRIGL